jgi:hypothetical protein
MVEKKDDFLQEIQKISKLIVENGGQCTYNNENFKESFFRQSSHSPDNLESMEHVEYGSVRKEYLENRKIFGLKVKNKEVLISDIIYFLESSEISKIIAREFPELTLPEIEAAQRVMTIIMSGLECGEIN